MSSDNSSSKDIWAIPPPFYTSFPPINQQQSAMKMYSRSQSFDKHVTIDDTNVSPTPPAPEIEKYSFQVRSRNHYNSKRAMTINTERWMPATKHNHGYHGCAPNGMRLFDAAPSLLLSKTKKLNRDEQLRTQLRRLKNDIKTFEESGGRQGKFEEVKSLAALAATKGKMVAEVREMEQVTNLRCASRWEPALGRRQLRATHGMRTLQPLLQT
jgi:hypothetical protein